MIQEKKKALRREIKARIKELDREYLLASDRLIEAKLLALPQYQNAGTIFCFVGTGGEPDTRGIILDALKQGKRVGVPKCLTDSLMEVYEIKSLDDLKLGMYDILEPKETLPVIDPKDIEFSIIPCVSCDFEGNRLGHGKGYYDRYLARASFFTCMLCRGKLMSEDIPVNELDVKPDIVISDYEKVE